MREQNIKRVIIVSLFIIAIGFWLSMIAYLLYQMTNILLIISATSIGVMIGISIIYILPYHLNLAWTKYTNRTGLSPGETAQIRTQALYFLLIGQIIGFLFRLSGFAWPLWVIPSGGGLLVGLSIGQITFALKNRSAVLSKK